MVEIGESIVGRAVELEALDRALGELQHGRAALLEIVGEPGIGKTRLLAELADRADSLGYLVLSGSASEFERDLPFSVFVDALGEFVESLDPRQLERLSDDIRLELPTVFPALSPLAEGRAVAVQQERFRSHRAVRELLELLAGAQPLVLVLDDLHWSDSGSVELLSALLRRPPAAPVLVAFALRPSQVPERLPPSLERAERAGLLIRLELAALTRAEADLLLQAADEEWLADLYAESGGNPFYFQQLARRQPRSGQATRGLALDGVDVPPAVAAALGEELALLSGEARTALEGAAVAGDPFEPEVAAAAADVSEPSFVATLDELLALDLIRPTDVPRRFRFRHPIVRRAVYESTPGGWRIGSHERCARALADRGAAPTIRAHHVEWSARHGDLDAVATLREAGDAAQRRTPESAARWFAAALRLLPSTSSDERIELLLSRARALGAGGRFEESHAVLVETMSVVSPEARLLRAQLTARCARLEHLLLRRVEARSRLERALAEVDNGDSPEAASLMRALAVESYYDMDPAAMYSWSTRALEATELAPKGLHAEALALRADAAVLSGLGPEARTYLDEAEAFIDGLGDDELEHHLDALAHVGTAEFYFPRFAAAVAHVERALAIGRATGQGDLFPSLYPVLAMALGRQGRIAEAIEVSETALEAARLLDNTHQIAWGLINRAYTALAAGDLDFALVTAQEARELAKQLDGKLVTVAAAHVFARVLLAMGEGAAAAELLEQVAGGPAITQQTLVSRVASLQTLARCLLSAGRTADAERAAREAAVCADRIRLPLATANSELTDAYVAVDAGDFNEAAKLAQSALATFEALDDVYTATLTRVLVGRALAGAGEQDGAVAQLERAAATFEGWGADRYRDDVERDLRKLGRHIHRRTQRGDGDDGIASLTKRELDVARLVSEGKSNPEIAAELFLSPKTVESHIRNMFRKLSVTSRVEVALAVNRTEATERR